MLKIKRALLVFGVAAVTVAASYAACWSVQWEPQCVRVNDCYGLCTPSGCGVSTCMIATSNGYEFGYNNTYGTTGSGFPNRYWDGTYNNCSVGSCKIYNNCTHQYEASPCGCDSPVKRYLPYGGNCP